MNTTEDFKSNRIKLAIELREQRRHTKNIKTELIRDLRVYYDNALPPNALYPFDYQYTEIFFNILRKKGLKCPIYHHLYIQVAKTMEECLIHSIPYDKRYVNGLSIINYDEYLKKNESEKDQIVFKTIVIGLKDIAEIDKLDMSIIENTIEEIKHKGLNTELEYLAVDNNKYKLIITYLSKSREEGCPVYLHLLEKSTGKSNKKQIGSTTKDQIYYWISKLTISNTHIKIKSRNSAKANMYLQDKPHNMEFSIKEILNG